MKRQKNFRLSEEVIAEIERLSEATGVSQAKVIERAVLGATGSQSAPSAEKPGNGVVGSSSPEGGAGGPTHRPAPTFAKTPGEAAEKLRLLINKKRYAEGMTEREATKSAKRELGLEA